MVNLERYLENFPLRGKDDFEKLQSLVLARQKDTALKQSEQARLEEELSVIRKTNTACVFLFFDDIVRGLKDVDATFHGVLHCSYLCYFLGFTKVNPMQYNLPFERYFSINRKHLPQAALVVNKGAKGQVVRYLKQKYGVDKIARSQDEPDEYVICSKSLLEIGEIKQTILHAAVGEFSWHEDVIALTWREIIEAGLYTISIREAEIGQVRAYIEEEIYQRALEWFKEYRENKLSIRDRYYGNEIAEAIFANTDGQYVYQEQFYEICTQILGVNNKKADVYRKALLTRKRNEIEEMKELFLWRMGEEGLALFEYIKSRHSYVVAKAYIIGLLFLGLP